ncbi:MAG: ribonuclease Z [Thermoplasmata archaeon]
MEIVFLGTSGSMPSPKRNVPAIAIKRGGEIILMDCGEGTQRQFMLSKLSFMQVSKILLTHFHGDHFLGLPGLVMTMALNDRSEPMEIYGPKGTVSTVKALLELNLFKPTFETWVHDVRPGDEVDCGGYYIKAARSLHQVPTLAFCIEEKMRPGRFNLDRAKELGLPEGPLYRKLQIGEEVEWEGRLIKPDMVVGPPRRGRKVVYTSDTRPNEDLVSFAQGCDVLIHDSTVESSLEAQANEYGHSSARQAAEMAKKCRAQVLFLTHISPRYGDPEAIEKEARKIFPESHVAQDFLEYDVPFPDGENSTLQKEI